MAKKFLDEKQNEAIDLLIVGNMSKLNIAKSIGIAEKTLYNWIGKNELFREELQRRTDVFNDTRILDAKNKLSVHLDMAIANIVEIANDKNNSKCYEANKYIVDRNLGGISTKIIEQSGNDNNTPNNNEAKLSYLEELEQDIESEAIVV